MIGPVMIDGLMVRVNDYGNVQYKGDFDWFPSSKTEKQVLAVANRKEIRADYERRRRPRKPKKKSTYYRLKEGTVFKSKSFGEYTVISDNGLNDVVIRFDSGYECTACRGTVRSGRVRDRFARTVYGVGYLGGTEYKSSGIAYRCWGDMMRACYSRIKRRSVCDEWHNFQVFAEWYYSNSNGYDGDMRVALNDGLEYSQDACDLVKSQKRLRV